MPHYRLPLCMVSHQVWFHWWEWFQFLTAWAHAAVILKWIYQILIMNISDFSPEDLKFWDHHHKQLLNSCLLTRYTLWFIPSYGYITSWITLLNPLGHIHEKCLFIGDNYSRAIINIICPCHVLIFCNPLIKNGHRIWVVLSCCEGTGTLWLDTNKTIVGII